MPSPPPCNHTPRTQCMSKEYLCLIEKHATIQCRPDHNWNVAHTLTRAFQRSLTTDYQRRAEVVAEEIGAFLGTTKGNYQNLKGDYTILKR